MGAVGLREIVPKFVDFSRMLIILMYKSHEKNIFYINFLLEILENLVGPIKNKA